MHSAHTMHEVAATAALLTMLEVAAAVPLLEDHKLRQSSDDGVVETAFRVALRCPLGFVRIEQPAKGFMCKHVQCFDLETYLQFGEKQLEWFCPICSKQLPVSDLRKSKLFGDILTFAGDCDDDDLVEIDPQTLAMKLCTTAIESGDGASAASEASTLSQSGTQDSQSSTLPQSGGGTEGLGSSSGAVILLSDDEDDGNSSLVVAPAPAGTGRVDQRTPNLQPFVDQDFDYFLDWAVVSGPTVPAQTSQPVPRQADNVIVISD